MMGNDTIEVFPQIKLRDERLVTRGDPASGIANLRILIELETPGFSIDLGGTYIAKRLADLVKGELGKLYAEGKDASGNALPPIQPKTADRRWRRLRQREDQTGARQDRFRVYGGANKSKVYATRDIKTPFHESGVIAENLNVQFKGTESGDPVWLVAWPSGGKKRGLVFDDGRGARLFAVEHYGADRLAGIPPGVDRVIDKELEAHLGYVLQETGSIARNLAKVVRAAERLIDEGSKGEL